jgi:ABC-type antimicrobial peptide transport system permease subunit
MRQREFWARLKRNRMAMIGLGLVLGLFMVSIFAPWLAPYEIGRASCRDRVYRLV